MNRKWTTLPGLALMLALSAPVEIRAQDCDALKTQHRALKEQMARVLRELGQCADSACLNQKKTELRELQRQEEDLMRRQSSACK